MGIFDRLFGGHHGGGYSGGGHHGGGHHGGGGGYGSGGRQRAGGVMAALLAPTARHLTRQALASASSAGLRWFLRLARNAEPHCNRVRSFALSAARQRSDRAMLVGYARVSTQDQNLELQREALTQAGCQKLFEDKLSGTRAERPGLAKALEMLRKGDTLVVWKLDRLGRSVKQLVDLVSELHKQSGTVAKLAMRQPFVLFKGLTFQKLCLPGAFRPGDHHNKMLRPGLCVVHASPQYL